MSSSLSALVESALQSVRAAKALAADAVTSARTSALGRLDAAFASARAAVEAASREAAADLARQSGEADDALTARMAGGAADLASACNRACVSLEDAAHAADTSLADRADAFLATDDALKRDTAPLASPAQPSGLNDAPSPALAAAVNGIVNDAHSLTDDDAEVFHLTEAPATLDEEDLQAINAAVLTSKAIMAEAEGLAAPAALPDEEVTASAANGPVQEAAAQPEAPIDDGLNAVKNRGAARKPRKRK